jgi:hypothetical protein
MAACPAGAAEGALEIYVAGSQPGADVAAIASRAGTLSDSCPDDAYANSILAPLNLALVEAAASPDEKQAWALRAWRAYRAAARGYDLPVRSITSFAGAVDVKPAADITLLGDIITALATTEAASGKPTPFSRPASRTQPPPACQPIDGDITALSYSYNMTDGPAGVWKIRLAMVDQRIAACESQLPPGGMKWLYGTSAKMRHDVLELKPNPAPADPAEMARTARTHLDRLFEISPDGLQSYFVSKNDRARMEAALAAFLPPIPESEWFLAKNIGSEYVIRSIGMELDAAWATDQKNRDIVATTYATLLNRAFTTAKAQPDPVKARLMLHQAARRHADGRIRRPENKSLPAPPGFQWEWISPYYQAPAPAATTRPPG